MNQQFIKDVFNGTYRELLNDIPEEYQQELLQRYLNYLQEYYQDIPFPNDGYQKFLEDEIESQKFISLNMPTLSKLSLFLKDEGYQELKELSNLGLEKARERLQENKSITYQEKDEKIAVMENAYHRVRPFNLLSAEQELSEGTLDYEYAATGRAFYSFRFGDEVSFLKNR